MASAPDLRDELNCSICLNIFSDPFLLSCGHNFCRVCIGDVLDTQGRSGAYSCPECRAEFPERPALQQNRTLHNIAQHFLRIEPKQGAESSAIPCTYCDVSVPALRTCAHCETSLCSKHLSKHSKAVEHVLIKPTLSLENRKCSVHREILRYYCTQDAVCICASCWITGTHQGHRVEMLSDAAEKMKATLREEYGVLSSEKNDIEETISSLQAHSVKMASSLDVGICRVNQLFSDIKGHLDTLKKLVESDINRVRSDDLSKTVKRVQQMKLRKALLSSRMEEIEELSTTADPLSVLQGLKKIHLDAADRSTPNDVDGVLSSVVLHIHCKELSDVLADLRSKHGLDLPEAADILLDINTASEDVAVSVDLKSASSSPENIRRPYTPERFQRGQVLSSTAFSSGRHFWEMETLAEHWIVGLSYLSIDRTQRDYPGPSVIGFNDKSWGLDFINGYNGVNHDGDYKSLSHSLEIKKVGLYLDYEVGRLSFYKLNNPITHIHTFTATFTEPLHLAVFVTGDGCIRIIS